MSKSIRILYRNCQSISQKHSELLRFTIKHKIDILLLNETYLNSNNQFKLPNFHTYRSDHLTLGRSKCGGTAILIHHKFTHNHVHTDSIENTIIHTVFKEKELRLGVLYKSHRKTLLTNDLDNLLDSNKIPFLLVT